MLSRGERQRSVTQQAAHRAPPAPDPHADQMHDDIPPYFFITKMATPAIGQIKPRMIESFADARVTRAGLAAIEHRNRTGSYPADLQALGLEDADDPFTGEPLVYRPGTTGFTLYSLGQDSVDDGGAPLDDKHNGDIVWGDNIVAIDGRRVRALDDLFDYLEEKQAGDRVQLTVSRDGRKRTVTVELSRLETR